MILNLILRETAEDVGSRRSGEYAAGSGVRSSPVVKKDAPEINDWRGVNSMGMLKFQITTVSFFAGRAKPRIPVAIGQSFNAGPVRYACASNG